MTSAPGMPSEVRHVRDALNREFSGLIDMSDYQNRSPNEQEQKFLSRALAALVVRKAIGCDSAAAAAAVFDGRADLGIDAVAIMKGSPWIWLVQSKWSDRGTAGFGVAEALKMTDGLRKIDQRRFGRFNDQFQRHVDSINEALEQPNRRITLVVALMGTADLSAEVVQCFEDAEEEFNRTVNADVLDHELWKTGKIWQVVRDDVAEPSISLVAKMPQWMQLAEPFQSYYGTVPVPEIAQWYTDHGDRLFSRNLRKSLGLTRVNLGIVETLTRDPESFWHLNNGITVLCGELELHPWSLTSAGPASLHLQSASVVNGAQTVTAIHEAMQQAPDIAQRGHVGVRVISTKGRPEVFDRVITEATNTQNRVDQRDFAALDSVQEEIRQDFRLSLDKTYVFKRGEIDPPPDVGCSIVYVARALACAHRNPELSVRAKRNEELLWEKGDQGVYDLLFKTRPGAHQIWRSVLLLRAVGTALHNSRRAREGRAEAIADHGDLLVTHIVFQHAGLDGIEDPDNEWEDTVLPRVPAVTAEVLAWLIYHVDDAFTPTSFVSSTFGNPQRCRELARRVLESLRGGTAVPPLRTEYRPAAPAPKLRRRKAVHVLIDAGRIQDGTLLVFQTGTDREQDAMAAWLAEDPRRGRATWVIDRSNPILWSADGKRYSPSGLVEHMWKLAGWEQSPIAVQGPMRWLVPGEGLLGDLAIEVSRAQETQDA